MSRAASSASFGSTTPLPARRSAARYAASCSSPLRRIRSACGLSPTGRGVSASSSATRCSHSRRLFSSEGESILRVEAAAIFGHCPPSRGCQIAWRCDRNGGCVDSREYHEASHWRKVAAVLVSTRLETEHQPSGDVVVCGRATLAQVLNDHAGNGLVDFDGWLRAPYAPLPSLVSAARRIFQHEHL